MTAAERETLHALFELVHAQEEHRKELREADEHWKQRMESKTDSIRTELRVLNDRLDAVPGQIQAAIDACRQERERITQPAVKAHANGLAVKAWWKSRWMLIAAATSYAATVIGLIMALIRLGG